MVELEVVKRRTLVDLAKLQWFLSPSNTIEGWFYPNDIFSIAVIDEIQTRQIGIVGGICEVGVYKGKSLTFLSHLTRPNERLYGYDDFTNDHKELTLIAMQKHGNQVQPVLKTCNTNDLTVQQLAQDFGDIKLRMLHIDAGHEYHEVLKTIMDFSPFLDEHGILIMDDYQDPEFPGIEAATLDFCEIDRPRRFVPFFSGQNKIYICVAHMAELWQKQMLKHSSIVSKCRATVVRDFLILKGFSRLPQDPAQIQRQIQDFYKNKNQYARGAAESKKISEKFSQKNFGWAR